VIASECPVSRTNLILSFKADAKDRPNLKIFHKDDVYYVYYVYYEKFHSEKYTLMNSYIA